MFVRALVMVFLFSSSALAAKPENNPNNEQGSTNGQPFKTLRAMIDVVAMDLQDAVQMLQANISAVEDRLQNQVDDLRDTQNTHAQLIGAIEAAIDLLTDRVAANEVNIAGLQSDVGSLEDQVDTLFSLDAFQAQLISVLRSDLTALDAEVTANDLDITALVDADAAIQYLIQANRGRINTLEQLVDLNAGDISTLLTEITVIEGDIDQLENELDTKQTLISGFCAPNSSIRRVRASGGVYCEKDDVSAGVGTLLTYTAWSQGELPSAGVFVGVGGARTYCPSNYQVTGGGFELVQLTDFGDVRAIQVYRARRDGNSYWVSGLNDNVVIGNNGRTAVRAFVDCIRII